MYRRWGCGRYEALSVSRLRRLDELRLQLLGRNRQRLSPDAGQVDVRVEVGRAVSLILDSPTEGGAQTEDATRGVRAAMLGFGAVALRAPWAGAHAKQRGHHGAYHGVKAHGHGGWVPGS